MLRPFLLLSVLTALETQGSVLHHPTVSAVCKCHPPPLLFVLLITDLICIHWIISSLTVFLSLSVSLRFWLHSCGPLSCPYLLPHMALCVAAPVLSGPVRRIQDAQRLEGEMPGMLKWFTQYVAPKPPLFILRLSLPSI